MVVSLGIEKHALAKREPSKGGTTVTAQSEQQLENELIKRLAGNCVVPV